MSTVASITRQDAILLHLSKYANKTPDVFDMPFGATQDGIAANIGISRAHASLELKKMIEKGQVDFIYAHTPQSPTKRRTYFLEPQGLSLVPYLKERMMRENIEESSVLVGEAFPRELKRDPHCVRAILEIEKATEFIDSGETSRALIHVALAAKELAMSIDKQ